MPTPVSYSLRFSYRQRSVRTGAGILADVSETGCRVRNSYPLDVSTSLALVAELPHPVLITEARVVWAVDQWRGLEFLRLSPTERTRLRHFLWKHIRRAVVNDQRPLFSILSASSQNRKGKGLKAVS